MEEPIQGRSPAETAPAMSLQELLGHLATAFSHLPAAAGEDLAAAPQHLQATARGIAGAGQPGQLGAGSLANMPLTGNLAEDVAKGGGADRTWVGIKKGTPAQPLVQPKSFMAPLTEDLTKPAGMTPAQLTAALRALGVKIGGK